MNLIFKYFFGSHIKIIFFVIFLQIIFSGIYSLKFNIEYPGFLTLFSFLFFNLLFLYLFSLCYNKFSAVLINKKLNTNLKIISLFVILICFTQLLNIQETLVPLIIEFIIGTVTLTESYSNSRLLDSSGSGYNIIAIFSNAFRNLIPFLVYLHLKIRNGRFDKYSILLLLSSLILIVQSFSMGHRGVIISVIFQYSFFIIILLNDTLFNEKVKIKIKKIGFTCFFILLSGFVAITASRFSTTYSKYDPLESIYAYQGQGLINFNKILNSSKTYYQSRELNRIFPFYKYLFETNDPIDYDSRMSRYYYLPSNESEFSTWLGDFSLDFPRFIVPFALLFLFLLIFIYSKFGNLNKLVCAYIVWIVLTEGTNLFPFADISGNIRLIILLGLPFILKIRFKHVDT